MKEEEQEELTGTAEILKATIWQFNPAMVQRFDQARLFLGCDEIRNIE